MDKLKLEAAIAYFEDAIRESDEIIAECTPDLQAELTEQKGHFVVALEAMRTPTENKALTVETRADDIRAMSDKELAAWIIYLQEHELSEKWCDSAKCLRRIDAQEKFDCTDELLVACVARWLGQATEED